METDRQLTPELDGKILGVNRRLYTGPGWIPVNITCVLVGGAIGDYSAYIAAGDDPDWAARHGNKISFDEACIHFPGGQLEKDRYRE